MSHTPTFFFGAAVLRSFSICLLDNVCLSPRVGLLQTRNTNSLGPQIMKLMLSASTAPDTPPAAKAKLKQHVLLRMADLVVKGTTCPVW